MRTDVPELKAPVVMAAKSQPEYQTVRIALVSHPDFPGTHGHNTALMRFVPTDDERQRIAAGEDIYVSLLTFGGPQQPIILQVGKQEAAQLYNVEALPVT